ncbi:MAG: TRAP transporter large permease subunit, partial [Roseovarius sp.]|nr:TRAP transporter large permease subunit [Roseovarius sp.]
MSDPSTDNAWSTRKPMIIGLLGLLLLVGTMLETISALTIFVPVLLPIINLVGIDPVYFGVIMVFTLM